MRRINQLLRIDLKPFVKLCTSSVVNTADTAALGLGAIKNYAEEATNSNLRGTRQARLNDVKQILGENAYGNYLKRTLVGQALRVFSNVFPEKFEGAKSALEIFQRLPYHVQTFIKYIATNQAALEPRLSSELQRHLRTILERKAEEGESKGLIGYRDYGWSDLPNDAKKEGLVHDSYNLGLQLHNALGYAHFELDEQTGEWVVSDRYDFNHYEGKDKREVLREMLIGLSAPFVLAGFFWTHGITGIGIIDKCVSLSFASYGMFHTSAKSLLGMFGPFLGEAYNNEIRLPKQNLQVK